MLSNISFARLAAVHPKLMDAVLQMDAHALELNLQVTQGLRTWAQQQQLYEQGRSTVGPIVTDVPGGGSWHNFGLAVDLVPEDITPGQPDWTVTHPAWAKMIAVGESVGLVSGSAWRSFPDNPHFQLTGRFPVTPDDEVRSLFLNGGIDNVWKESGL